MIRLAHEGDERLVAFWGSLLPLAQDPSYLDVTLVCKDGKTRGNRLLLALAIPHMEDLLREREGEETTMLLPDFKIQEVVRRVEDFFQKQVHLDLHVKVRKNWRSDERELKRVGYK